MDYIQQYDLIGLLDALGADLTPPTAAELGVKITAAHVKLFLDHIQADPAAKGLRKYVFPRIAVGYFSQFVLLASFPIIEATARNKSKERGRILNDYLRLVRQQARKSNDPAIRQELPEMLRRARIAYDERRMGNGNAGMLWVIDGYIQFRVGRHLRPKEWEALFNAAGRATGNEREIDGVHCFKSVQRFKGLSHALPAHCVAVIECRMP